MDLRPAHLVVELPFDRDRLGLITLLGADGRALCGPFPVGARASDALASANGNPRRDPLLRYGDTPTGGFRVLALFKSGGGTLFPARQFGPNGLVVLEPTSGAAALAEANGRFHFAIRGGPLARTGELVSTAGSLRLADRHQRALVSALRKLGEVRCDIRQSADLGDHGRVFVDAACEDDDPLDLPDSDLAVEPAAAAARQTSREALRIGADGGPGVRARRSATVRTRARPDPLHPARRPAVGSARAGGLHHQRRAHAAAPVAATAAAPVTAASASPDAQAVTRSRTDTGADHYHRCGAPAACRGANLPGPPDDLRRTAAGRLHRRRRRIAGWFAAESAQRLDRGRSDQGRRLQFYNRGGRCGGPFDGADL